MTGKIWSLAKQYSNYTAGNLSELVRIKSLSMGEKEVQECLLQQMKDAGFDDAYMDPLGNVIGRIGNGSRILAIDGHIDTVDVGDPGA